MRKDVRTVKYPFAQSLCVLFVDLSDGLIVVLLFSSCRPYVVQHHQSITQPPTPHQEVARQSRATNSQLQLQKAIDASPLETSHLIVF